MATKQYKIITLLLFITFGSFLSLASFSPLKLNSQTSDSNFYQKKEFYPLKISDAIPYGAIEQNASTIYRLFESINFTIDTSTIIDANYTKMHISFSDNSTGEFDMQFDGNSLFSYEYKPGYDAPLGFHNVSFSIYNNTHTLLNTQSTFTNFTIKTNYLMNFDQCEYYIEDILNAELIVCNFSTYDFTWNITIVDNLEEAIQSNILTLEKKLVQFNFPINNETFIEKNHLYFIQLNMTDKNSGKRGTAYFPFSVRNNDPTITSSLELSSDEVLRTEDCTISFNATDVETLSKNLQPIMNIYDAQGSFLFQRTIDFESGNSFSHTFSIPENKPIGNYKIEIAIADEHGGTYLKETSLKVKNNPPEIHSYTINEKSMDQSISVPYGRNLVFKFNVSDIEEVSYVTIALLDENSEWFNVTKAYTGENTEITVRSVDLISGSWFVYVYVIDSDGAITSLIDDYDMAPQEFTIIPDIISNYLPWILLFTGMGIGTLLGILIIYSYLKKKFTDSLRTAPKRKEISTKKSSIKKKVKTKPIERKVEKEEKEELKTEKEEEKEGVPKRKIKRQL